MAVLDAAWWGVWWPWLLGWGITAVLLIATVAIVVVHRRRHRAPAATRLHGIAFYLDNESVIDLYQYDDKYGGSLRREVEERTSSNRGLKLSAKYAQIEGSAKRDNNRDFFTKYTVDTKPITVIGDIINVLDKADDIVYVDLRKKDVLPNRVLDTGDERLYLSDLDTFVSIRGRFRQTDSTPAKPGSTPTVTFQAPYGDSADGPLVHLTCTKSGLRSTTVPDGPFPARCLGRVQDWDPDTNRWIVHPIAIFR